ncbi:MULTISPECIES: serine/threonine-protein kinase [unclassified Kitasatospora]|uniref:serine/threonine-protein kinase n=1 Tax=unclassified Kitasatospora TaxID=2633591 RepID=UPI0033E2E859
MDVLTISASRAAWDWEATTVYPDITRRRGLSMQGAVIGGRYRMGERIGSGGMGEIWSAHDTRLARDVAVKLILPRFDGMDDSAEQARFQREARLTARLHHPNIVGVHDCGIHLEAGLPMPFVVMDLLAGQSLAALLKSGRRPGVAEVVDWGMQVCGALAVAHREGVVHRDIKPANLFLTRRVDGTEAVVVLDFGIAAYLQGNHTQLTPDGYMIGTAAYMAPEQARRESVDGRADLYALGCVLYELLTGAPPFGIHANPAALAAAHMYEPPVPLRQHRPDLPHGLDRLLLQLLAKSPAGRPPSALAAAEALAGATDDRLPTAGELTVTYDLANSLGRLGRHGEAAALLDGLAADRARVLGADHPDTIKARHNRAYNLGEAGRHLEAAALLERVVADRARVLGPDHPHTLTARHNQAYYLGQAGQHARAAVLLEGVVADRARVLGPDHPHTLTARHNHACNLGEAGRHLEAAGLLERVAADRARVLGPSHRLTVMSRRSHAVYAERIGRFG